MSKKTLSLTLILAAISGILIYAGTKNRVPQPPPTVNQQAETTVAVVVDAGEGQSATYSVKNPADATAFGVLKAAAEANGFALDYDPPGQYGVFVKGIAGKAGSKEMFWGYSVNGTAGTIAADKQTLKSGDTVTWAYTPVKDY